MPIHQIPLLDYWLSSLKQINAKNIYINAHYRVEILRDYVRRPRFRNWVKLLYERELAGTAGTIRNNKDTFYNKPLLLIHSDNWCELDLQSFIEDSQNQKDDKILFSMVTFNSLNPKSCGIVTIDKKSVVTQFQEKTEVPISNLANGAVYFLSAELVNWICNNQFANDFSLDVIPKFIGRILTWHNTGYHRDIGTIEELKRAQNDPKRILFWKKKDKWLKNFQLNTIHDELNEIK